MEICANLGENLPELKQKTGTKLEEVSLKEFIFPSYYDIIHVGEAEAPRLEESFKFN